MKVAVRDTPRFIAAPPDSCRAILLYGPDSGLARTQFQALLKVQDIDRQDAFAYTELDMATILETPSRLYEALQSVSLTGQAPCIAVRDATDKLTSILKDALEETPPGNRLLLVAGDLPKRSSLRSLFENAKAKELAAIACYRDEGRDLAQVIRGFLSERGIRCSPDVMPALIALLGNDRAVTLSELEKLDVYLGQERTLDEATVLALLGDNQHVLLGDAALAWLAGDRARFFRLCDQLFQSGESPVALLRVLLNGTQRLLSLHQKMAEGASQDQAMASLRPPVFYKDKPLYGRALQRFDQTKLLRLLARLQVLEVDVKLSPIPEVLLLQTLGIGNRAPTVKVAAHA